MINFNRLQFFLFLLFTSLTYSISFSVASDNEDIYNEYYADLFIKGKMWIGQFIFINDEYQPCNTIECILYVEEQITNELNKVKKEVKDEKEKVIKMTLLKKELSKINNYTRTDFATAKRRLLEIEKDFINIHGINSSQAGSFYAYLGAASITDISLSSNKEAIKYLVQSYNSYTNAIKKEYNINEINEIDWEIIIEDDLDWLVAIDTIFDFQFTTASLIAAYGKNGDKQFIEVRSNFKKFVDTFTEDLLLMFRNSDEYMLSVIDAPAFGAIFSTDTDFAEKYLKRLENYCLQTIKLRGEVQLKIPGQRDVCDIYHLQKAQLLSLQINFDDKSQRKILDHHISKQFEKYELLNDSEKLQFITVMIGSGHTEILSLKDQLENALILKSKAGSASNDLNIVSYALDYNTLIRIESGFDSYKKNKNNLVFLNEIRSLYPSEYSDLTIPYLLPLDLLILELQLINNPEMEVEIIDAIIEKLQFIKNNPKVLKHINSNDNFWLLNAYDWTWSTLLQHHFDKNDFDGITKLIDDEESAGIVSLFTTYDLQAFLCSKEKDYHCAIKYNAQLIDLLEKEFENSPFDLAYNTRLIETYQIQGDHFRELKEYSSMMESYFQALSYLKNFKLVNDENDLNVGISNLETLENNINTMISWIIYTQNETFSESYLPTEKMEVLFQATQFLYTSKLSQSIQRMIDRTGFEDENFRQLIKEKQDIEMRVMSMRQDTEQSLQDNLSPSIAKELSQEYIKLKEELVSINKLLANNKNYNTALNVQDIKTLYQVTSSLGESEALLIYYTNGEYPFLWCITKDSHFIYPLADKQKINQNVSLIRASILQMADQNNNFNYESSSELYSILIQPIEDMIKDKSELIIISDDILSQIPFDILPDSANFNNEGNNWLIKKYAITSLPTLDLFIDNQKDLSDSISEMAFLGIGDPVLSNQKDDKNHKSFNEVVVNSKYLDRIFRNTKIANSSQLSELPELPETSNELEQIASYFNESNVRLFLRESAREETVKNLNLSNFNIISFATHTLPAQKGNLLSEPGLVLTLPETSSLDDDGILTVSEIANLNLDADLVVLSACDTALSDNFEKYSLSGLAQSFIYSGAKSLILSHWPVETNSTVDLITSTFNYWINDNQPLSRALQKSKINLMKNKKYEHPMFWSSFSLYGSY